MRILKPQEITSADQNIHHAAVDLDRTWDDTRNNSFSVIPLKLIIQA